MNSVWCQGPNFLDHRLDFHGAHERALGCELGRATLIRNQELRIHTRELIHRREVCGHHHVADAQPFVYNVTPTFCTARNYMKQTLVHQLLQLEWRGVLDVRDVFMVARELDFLGIGANEYELL